MRRLYEPLAYGLYVYMNSPALQVALQQVAVHQTRPGYPPRALLFVREHLTNLPSCA